MSECKCIEELSKLKFQLQFVSEPLFTTLLSNNIDEKLFNKICEAIEVASTLREFEDLLYLEQPNLNSREVLLAFMMSRRYEGKSFELLKHV